MGDNNDASSSADDDDDGVQMRFVCSNHVCTNRAKTTSSTTHARVLIGLQSSGLASHSIFHSGQKTRKGLVPQYLDEDTNGRLNLEAHTSLSLLSQSGSNKRKVLSALVRESFGECHKEAGRGT